jgi:hypothetical protein
MSADISRSGESGSKLVITVEYRAPATGAPDHAGPAQRYERRFVRKELGWDKFNSDQYRIDTSLAYRIIDLWYAENDPHDAYLEQPDNDARKRRGVAGIVFGAAIMGLTLFFAKRGPDGVVMLVEGFFGLVQCAVASD